MTLANTKPSRLVLCACALYLLLHGLFLAIGRSADWADPQAVLETIMRKDQEIKDLRDEVTRLTAEVRTCFIILYVTFTSCHGFD